MATHIRVGKRGAPVIPSALRRRYHLEGGALVLVEEQDGGLLLKPASVTPTQNERRRFFTTLADQVASTRAHVTAWEEETAEREALVGTLLDGLEEDGGSSHA